MKNTMKNYKLLVPLVLVVLFLLSVYMTYDTNGTTERLYDGYMQEARSFAAQGIVVDALKNYTNAMEIRDSFPLQMEVALLYVDNQDYRSAKKWGSQMLDAFPNNVEVYDYLMNLHYQTEDYIACFQLADIMLKRKLPMDGVQPIMAEIENAYFFKGAYEDVSIFSEGYCAVMRKSAWGFVNETGGGAVDTKYTHVGAFRMDLAPVTDNESASYYIDAEGSKKKVVMGVGNIERLGVIEEGCFTLYDGASWGLYNELDEPVALGFDDVSSYLNGVIAGFKEGKWFLLDSSGAQINENTFDGIIRDEKGAVYRNGRLFIKESGSYYLIDRTGKKITETPYEDAKLFCDNTYAAVKVNGKWGFINKDGVFLIQPEYTDARSFSNGFAAVCENEQWGFIDMDNACTIPYQFDDSKDFNSHGCVFIKRGEEWNLLKLYKYNH